MKEYEIVTAENDILLKAKVNTMLGFGWDTAGGPYINYRVDGNDMYCQAMTRPVLTSAEAQNSHNTDLPATLVPPPVNLLTMPVYEALKRGFSTRKGYPGHLDDIDILFAHFGAPNE